MAEEPIAFHIHKNRQFVHRLKQKRDTKEIKDREVNAPFGMTKSRLSKRHLKPETSENLIKHMKEFIEQENYYKKTRRLMYKKESRVNIKTIFQAVCNKATQKRLASSADDSNILIT